MLLRLVRQLTLVLVWAHPLVGYYPPPRHRRGPAALQQQWPRLGTVAVAAPRALSSYPVFGARPARMAIRHG